jgi:hypothetical protein
MGRAEHLQGLHPAEAGHRPLTSSEGQVAVLGVIVRPAADLLSLGGADLAQGCPVRA